MNRISIKTIRGILEAAVQMNLNVDSMLPTIGIDQLILSDIDAYQFTFGV